MIIAVIERDIIVVQNLVLLYATIFVLVNVLVDLSLRLAGPADPLSMSPLDGHDSRSSSSEPIRPSYLEIALGGSWAA